MNKIDILQKSRSGVLRVVLEQDRETISNGTAFITEHGIISNSHVLLEPEYETAVFHFDDQEIEPIRILKEDLIGRVIAKSPALHDDFVLVEFKEPELDGKYRFTLGSIDNLAVGDEVIFHGYPFNMTYLTSHHGYVSSIHKRDMRQIIQIDGSVNGGNSGGPLLEAKNGEVVGIVTRAVTGYIETEFNNLITQLNKNIQSLESNGRVFPNGSYGANQKETHTAMRQIAINLKRSVNVGIGYAHAIDHLTKKIKG